MSHEVFSHTLRMAAECGCAVTLGGGEPTIHPLFWTFMGELISLQHMWDCTPHIITNGSVTGTALALAALARRGIIGAELSQDAWHEPVAEEVVRAFTVDRSGGYTRGGGGMDLRGIRTARSDLLIYAGRAKSMALDPQDKCPCNDLFVGPDGRVWVCGCKKKLVGRALDLDARGWGELLEVYYETCSRDLAV